MRNRWKRCCTRRRHWMRWSTSRSDQRERHHLRSTDPGRAADRCVSAVRLHRRIRLFHSEKMAHSAPFAMCVHSSLARRQVRIADELVPRIQLSLQRFIGLSSSCARLCICGEHTLQGRCVNGMANDRAPRVYSKPRACHLFGVAQLKQWRERGRLRDRVRSVLSRLRGFAGRTNSGELATFPVETREFVWVFSSSALRKLPHGLLAQINALVGDVASAARIVGYIAQAAALIAEL